MANTAFKNHVKSLEQKIGSGVTNTTQLNFICKSLFGDKYHGTYSSNQLPNLSAKKPYAITNVDNSKQRGSHWVAIFRDPVKRKYMLFDSFERPTRSLIPSAYKKYKPVDTDYDVDQRDNQDDCGQSCVSFLRICDELGWNYALTI